MAKHRRRRSRGLSGLGALSPMQLGLGVLVLGGLAFWFLSKKDKPEEKKDAAQLPAGESTSQTPTASDAEIAAMVAGLTDAELSALATAGAAGEAIGGLTAEQVKSILPAVQAELAKRTTVPVPPAGSSGSSSDAVDIAVDPSAGKPAAETGVTDMRAVDPRRGAGKGRGISPGRRVSPALRERLMRLQKARENMQKRRAAASPFQSSTPVNVNFKF